MTDLFTNAHRYGDLDAWRREAVALHARGPIHRIEQPGYQPFWAVIGHDAVLDIERRPDEFTNAPIPILGSDEQLSIRAAGGAEIRTLIHMDEPDHAKYRKLTNDWFKPVSIRRLTDRLDELSRQAVAKLEGLGGEADFYTHRARVSLASHLVDPRSARSRLSEDDQAHSGDVRCGGPRPAT